MPFAAMQIDLENIMPCEINQKDKCCNDFAYVWNPKNNTS